MAAASSGEAIKDTAAKWIPVESSRLSRLLYANPVCLLSVYDPKTGSKNVMAITWLSCINNKGGFICSVNTRRHTAHFLRQPGTFFVLNVPVQGMEKLIISIGSCSGALVDKFEALDIKACAPGFQPQSFLSEVADVHHTIIKQKSNSKKSQQGLKIQEALQSTKAIESTVAHCICEVKSVHEDDGHLILRCTQLAAWCREEYWNGHQFFPRSLQGQAMPRSFLTFMGSKVFGYVAQSENIQNIQSKD
uniref:Phosphatidylinositide phosphatase SAC1like protein putative n=1 Tax=Albugo laibachii Nc14 TaxID=890382 RepID=F0VZX7_9STRA|nr:phosphatidylinositide phosphatase SAC1like protein putative [Albugo laibachii Nc14]|eukprot:CCA14348.1 phosphatidylinositide phosphatase SAC1like protein putative [Albugo laibachii Nc14]